MTMKQKAKIPGIYYLIFIILSVLADQLAAFAQADTLTVLERIQTSPRSI